MTKDFTTYSRFPNETRHEFMQISIYENYTIEENMSDRLRIIFIKEGNGRLLINDTQVLWFAPTIICISENIPCKELQSKDTQVFYFHPNTLNQQIDFNNFRDDSDNSNIDVVRNRFLLKVFTKPITVFNHLATAKLSQVNSLFISLNEELNTQPTQWWPCRSRSYMSELLFLIGQLDESQNENSSLQNKKYFSDKIQLTIDYILNNYQKKITLSDIALAVGTNRTSLNMLFKKETGKTTIAYLIEVRIQIASSMLINTELPINEISERTGFSDTSYFERQFKKLFNVTPINYRNSTFKTN